MSTNIQDNKVHSIDRSQIPRKDDAITHLSNERGLREKRGLAANLAGGEEDAAGVGTLL